MRCLLFLLVRIRAVQAQPSPETLIEQGHGKRARVIIEARFAQNPNDPETLYLMSWIKQALGDSAAAQQLAERAVDGRAERGEVSLPARGGGGG